jgi:hypothetical protein
MAESQTDETKIQTDETQTQTAETQTQTSDTWTGTQLELCASLIESINKGWYERFIKLLPFVDSSKWENGIPPDLKFEHPVLHQAVEQCNRENGIEILRLLLDSPHWKPFIKSRIYLDKNHLSVMQRIVYRIYHGMRKDIETMLLEKGLINVLTIDNDLKMIARSR